MEAAAARVTRVICMMQLTSMHGTVSSRGANRTAGTRRLHNAAARSQPHEGGSQSEGRGSYVASDSGCDKRLQSCALIVTALASIDARAYTRMPASLELYQRRATAAATAVAQR